MPCEATVCLLPKAARSNSTAFVTSTARAGEQPQARDAAADDGNIHLWVCTDVSPAREAAHYNAAHDTTALHPALHPAAARDFVAPAVAFAVGAPAYRQRWRERLAVFPAPAFDCNKPCCGCTRFR